MVAANQAVRNGDYTHKRSIGRQRKQAGAPTPAQQAKAMVRVIRKRLGDGQALDAAMFEGLGEDSWAELLCNLATHEVAAVNEATGASDDDTGDDDAPIPYDVVPAPARKPLWRDELPALTHHYEWHDSEGDKHGLTIRADNLDELLRQLTAVKALVATARYQAQNRARTEAPSEPGADSAPDEPRPDWCAKHGVFMPERTSKDGTQRWFSHYDDASGKWCRGK